MKQVEVATNPAAYDEENRRESKPLISVVVPAYNEAQLVEKNLALLCEYMESLEHKYSWELIVVDDGSTDETGQLAEAFSKRN